MERDIVMHIGKWVITIKDLVWFIVCLILALCFCVGLFIYDKGGASAVLSGASTAVSIVLSIVAILYTMIEGANSSKVNQDTQNKLDSIDLKLKDVTDKLSELKELDRKIKYVVPKLDTTFQKLEQSSPEGSKALAEDGVKKDIEYLMSYINEDIDD